MAFHFLSFKGINQTKIPPKRQRNGPGSSNVLDVGEIAMAWTAAPQDAQQGEARQEECVSQKFSMFCFLDGQDRERQPEFHVFLYICRYMHNGHGFFIISLMPRIYHSGCWLVA